MSVKAIRASARPACSVFLEAALVSPFRVADPRHASFFWVPYWHAHGSAQVTLNIFHSIKQRYPFFNASIAAGFPNHVIVQPQDLGFFQPAWADGSLADDTLNPYSLVAGMLRIELACGGIPVLCSCSLHALAITWPIFAGSDSRMLISLQFNARQDSGECPDRTMVGMLPGKDIALPPITSQEDGFGNKVKFSRLQRAVPLDSSGPVVSNRTNVRLYHVCECAEERTSAVKPQMSVTLSMQELFFCGAIPPKTIPDVDKSTGKIGNARRDIGGRGSLYALHRGRPGFNIINTWNTSETPVNALKGSLASEFCYIPYGQGGGYGGRCEVQAYVL